MNTRFRRGDVIYRQGEGARYVYRAVTGMVRLATTTARGRTVTLRHVLPGDYFGEGALTRPTREHNAEALTGASVELLDPYRLDDRELWVLTQNLGEQLRRAMNFEVHLQSGDLRQRVVRYLLELADTPLGAEDAENRLFVRATHELLAEGSGSTRESVSKVITDLRADGLIDTGYRHITLVDLPALQSVVTSLTVEELPRSRERA